MMASDGARVHQPTGHVVPPVYPDSATPHQAIVTPAKIFVASIKSSTGRYSSVPCVPQPGSPMPKIREGCPSGNQKLASQTNGAVSTTGSRPETAFMTSEIVSTPGWSNGMLTGSLTHGAAEPASSGRSTSGGWSRNQ